MSSSLVHHVKYAVTPGLLNPIRHHAQEQTLNTPIKKRGWIKSSVTAVRPFRPLNRREIGCDSVFDSKCRGHATEKQRLRQSGFTTPSLTLQPLIQRLSL